MGISGESVSPLVFAGLDTIDSVTHTTMRLNWPVTIGATSFIIFQVDGGGNLTFVQSIPNTGGTVASSTVENLVPNTAHTFRVRAIDALGNQEGNTSDVSATTNVNQLPVLQGITSPPFFSGELTATVDARDDDSCGMVARGVAVTG